VSKAFTDEEAAELPRVVPPRAPLPVGVPNYVTEGGSRSFAPSSQRSRPSARPPSASPRPQARMVEIS